MMLMNSTTSKFLIEEQLAGLRLFATGVETLPMGYVAYAPGGRVEK